MKKTFAVILFCLSLNILAQTKEEEKVIINFGGFFRTDLIFDSRQIDAQREGHQSRYPLNKELDARGNDLNDKANMNILPIHSRFFTRVTGPTLLGIKPSGYFEGDFFGSSDANMNVIRVRQLFAELKMGNSSLLLGQTWHPMFVVEANPQVLASNTGAPFTLATRIPQIKFTHNLNNLVLNLALSTQRDGASEGPAGASSSYLRNGILPELTATLHYKFDKNILGVGVDYNSLMPRIKTTKNLKTDERINSVTAEAFTKITSGSFNFTATAVYGQNMSHFGTIGGYGVTSVDTTTGFEEYTNINTISGWFDCYFGGDLKFGLFAGYSKNLGADENISTFYGRGNNIEYLYRISPRVLYNIGQVRLATELEYTGAAYGTPDIKSVVNNAAEVNNLRVQLSVFYFFNIQ